MRFFRYFLLSLFTLAFLLSISAWIISLCKSWRWDSVNPITEKVTIVHFSDGRFLLIQHGPDAFGECLETFVRIEDPNETHSFLSSPKPWWQFIEKYIPVLFFKYVKDETTVTVEIRGIVDTMPMAAPGYTIIAIHFFYPTLFFGLLSLLSFFICRKHFRKLRIDLCLKCRYDLRMHATGANCPECGTPIPKPPTSPSL